MGTQWPWCTSAVAVCVVMGCPLLNGVKLATFFFRIFQPSWCSFSTASCYLPQKSAGELQPTATFQFQRAARRTKEFCSKVMCTLCRVKWQTIRLSDACARGKGGSQKTVQFHSLVFLMEISIFFLFLGKC